ncbi:15578_t:CDS:2, partial [Racocetra persica]
MNHAVSDSPGVRECHCLFTYNNSVYLFGGHIKWNTWAVNSFFHTAKMPFITSSIPWVALNTTNAVNTCDMTCVVEPSMGLLLVIGGSWAQDPGYEGLQVYNFKSNVWNEAQYLVGYPSAIGMGIFQPRSVLIEPGIVLIWGGTRHPSTLRVIYKLNMTVTPWKWEPIVQNMTTVLNSVGISRSRERVFIFGGIDKVNVPSTTVGEE